MREAIPVLLHGVVLKLRDDFTSILPLPAADREDLHPDRPVLSRLEI
jgi:hypothetical protein